MNRKIKLCSLIILVCCITPILTFSQDGLLILTPDEFKDELEPLKRFKDCSCRPTVLLTLDQIYIDFSGVDKPAKIKRCIAHYQKTNGIKSVLLVGDVDKFPVRWRWWGRWMPNDPYFKGNWSIQTGSYFQLEITEEKPYCSWIDIGSYDEYVIEVDCMPIVGDGVKRETRICYADADRHNCRYRIDLLPQMIRIVSHKDKTTNFNFNLNQNYKIKIEVSSTVVKVWIDGVYQLENNLKNLDEKGRGKIGLGTYLCATCFDNLTIKSDNSTLWDENFNDGVANGFTEAPTMDERWWNVSDLYYADLYKTDGSFDSWDSNNNKLYGEIEFKIANYNPTAVINNDNIDFVPDIAVGRIPASTKSQVRTYVNRVIYYEMVTQKTDSWFKKTILLEGSNSGSDNNDDIADFLQDQGFTVINHHWSNGLENLSDSQKRDLVVNYINQGAGLINYIGHGNYNEWSCLKFSSNEVDNSLQNSEKLPIITAAACYTGKFAPIPPEEKYIDTNNEIHRGTIDGNERFPGPPEYSDYAFPLSIQEEHDPDCIAENFLFLPGVPQGTNGAIAYLGERSVGRHWANTLVENFYKAYETETTIGLMWKEMIIVYYWSQHLNESHTWNYEPKEWDTGHMFDEPQKFILFGDPSLHVGGAFNTYLSGNIDDGTIGTLGGYSRYRLTGDVTIPAGQKLSSNSTMSILFEDGKKIKALGSASNEGLIIKPSSGHLVCFMSLAQNPQSEHVVQGIKIKSELKMRNGGEIKLY